MNEYFINELKEQEEDSDSYDDESVGYEIEFAHEQFAPSDDTYDP